MNMSNTTKIIIVIIGALLAILAIVVLLIIRSNGNNEQSKAPDNQTSDVSAYSEQDVSNGAHRNQTDDKKIETETSQPEQMDEEMQMLYLAALDQILTTGEWKDDTGNIILSFTSTNYTAVNTKTDKVETKTCQYVITSFSVVDDVYTIKWTLTENNGSKPVKSDAKITVNGNGYILASSSLPYAQAFTKTVDIVFNQPTGPKTDPVNNKDPNKTITSVEISRDDNPGADIDANEFEADINREIIGTWKGTFEDMPGTNTVYWVYSFSADGKYTFSNGEINERGMFTLTHDLNNVYHSTLNLTLDSGEKRTVSFYISDSHQAVRMIIDSIDEPTYTKVG